MAVKVKKTVLLAGLRPEDLGRCQGMIKASLLTADDKNGVLKIIQRCPEVAVINFDRFGGESFLRQIAQTGYKGKVISATNKRTRSWETENIPGIEFVSFRGVPDAVESALAPQ